MRRHRDFAACAASLPVLTRWTIHPVRLRLASVSAITVSFVVWKESWNVEASSTLLLHEQRAVRQPDLFMHSTWSLRDDYHSRHRGPSMGSAVPGMRKSRGRKGAQGGGYSGTARSFR